MAAVALISAMYAASACLFRRVWGEYFGTGYLFLVVYALLPLGVEGTYWISASNRVVPSLFFVALAMYLFQKWCRTGRARWLPLYFRRPAHLLLLLRAGPGAVGDRGAAGGHHRVLPGQS